MPKGRKPVHPEILKIKGSRNRRKILLDSASGTTSASPPSAEIPIPNFLNAQEEEIFRTAVAFARWTRPADYTALGRWCCYLRLWTDVKQNLGGLSYTSESKHGALLRKTPQFAALLDLEKTIAALEVRIGLDPASRQAIIRGLSFSSTSLEPALDEDEISPLSWMQRPRKPN